MPSDPLGGGIRNYNGGLLQVISSILTSNTGGGIVIQGGTLTVTRSILSGNSATSGGGIAMQYGTLHVTGSTFSGNSGDYFGGGIYIYDGALQLTGSTLSGNSASSGAGIYVYDGIAQIVNGIIANSSGGGDCAIDSGTITSQGHNIDGDGTCNLTAPGDQPNTDPLLGPLQDNGGPTWTHALLLPSPAVDAGDDTACPATDQRGVPRPYDGDGDGFPRCDIGAFEYVGPPPERIYLPVVMHPS